jgi:hypothetical protein
VDTQSSNIVSMPCSWGWRIKGIEAVASRVTNDSTLIYRMLRLLGRLVELFARHLGIEVREHAPGIGLPCPDVQLIERWQAVAIGAA